MKSIHFIISFITFSVFMGCRARDDYQQPSHRYWLETHEFAIGQKNLLLEDRDRNRPIKTEIWYPTHDTSGSNVSVNYPFKLPRTSFNAKIASGTFPLVLLSHGTGGNRISQMWLAGELAGNGYIVASVDHYGNTLDNKIPENFVRIWDRPLDLTFLLDKLLQDTVWSKSIDPKKIGMAGFSLGGYTGMALAGSKTNFEFIQQFADTKQGKSEFIIPELGDIRYLLTPELIQEGNRNSSDLKDDRISAFVIMAPALGAAFRSKDQFIPVRAPILIIGAADDKRTPVDFNARHYHRLIGHSQYLELGDGAGHYIFMNEAKNWLKREAKTIFHDKNGIDRAEIHQEVTKVIINFLDKHVKDNHYEKME